MPNIRSNPLVLLQAPFMMTQFFLHALRNSTKFDILHAHWIPTAIPLTVVCWLKKIPLVITLHGEDLKLLRNSILKLILLPVLRKATAIVCVNNSAHSELNNSLPVFSKKTHCIPYGVSIPKITADELQSFKSTKDFPKRYLSALFVGSVVERKGVHTLVEAIAKTPEWSVIICGRIQDQRYYQSLCEQIDRLNCKERIFFEGAVNPQQIPLYMAAANAYVSASSHEGRPNAVLEALASGMPVVLSDIPAHQEIIDHGTNGMLFPLNDASVLCATLNNLALNKELVAKLSTAAKTTVAKMSWQNCAAQYTELFKQLL